MRQCVLALLAAACAAGTLPAVAADIPVKALPAAVVAYNWSGVYVGGHAGGAKQRNCEVSTRSIAGTGPSPGPATTTTSSEGCHRDTDVVSGGQVGVSWQSGSVVLGAEASGSWANLKGSSISEGFPLFTNETRTDAIGLFTGRLGVAWDNALLYVKGGAARTHNKYTAFPTASLAASSATSDSRWGWTAGGGFEYGFTPDWSAAVEYDFIDTGTKSEVFPSGTICGASPCTSRIDQHIHMVMLRLNYRLASWASWH
jgi:outer membrane immunogenic protein